MKRLIAMLILITSLALPAALQPLCARTLNGKTAAAACAAAQYGQNEKTLEESIIKTEYGKIIDGKEGKAVLKGSFNEGGIYAENIKIDIYDLNDELIQTVKIEEGGYSPDIKILNFDEEQSQIFYGASTGGSGGFGIFYVFENGAAIFDYKDFDSGFEAVYENGYKVSVRNRNYNYLVDISQKSDDVLSLIYDADGKLLKPLNAEVSAVNHVAPFYNYLEKKFGLTVYQKITGLFQADGIGTVQTYLYKEGDRFDIQFSTVAL